MSATTLRDRLVEIEQELLEIQARIAEAEKLSGAPLQSVMRRLWREIEPLRVEVEAVGSHAS